MVTAKTNLKEKLTKLNEKVEATASSTRPLAIVDASKFVYVDDFLKALELAYKTGENIICYGKGGHGKSELVEYFLKSKGHEPFIQTMGAGTTTERLFGGVDLKKFNDTGILDYYVENSFMNHEIVIFEELMDAPDYILESLKDILTSRKFRNGNQVFDIKTRLIICNTNRTRDEFSKNDSLKALMERFPLEYKVEWDSYNRTTYGYMFQTMFGKNFKTLEYILEKLAQASSIVSPRTAMKAAKVIDANGGDYSCLDFFADFSGKHSKMVKEEIKKYKTIEEVEQIIDNVKVMIKDCDKVDLTTLDNLKTLKTLLQGIDNESKKLKGRKVDDDLMKTINAATTQFDNYLVKKAEEIQAAASKA